MVVNVEDVVAKAESKLILLEMLEMQTRTSIVLNIVNPV